MDGPRRSHVASVPEPVITEDQNLGEADVHGDVPLGVVPVVNR